MIFVWEQKYPDFTSLLKKQTFKQEYNSLLYAYLIYAAKSILGLCPEYQMSRYWKDTEPIVSSEVHTLLDMIHVVFMFFLSSLMHQGFLSILILCDCQNCVYTWIVVIMFLYIVYIYCILHYSVIVIYLLSEVFFYLIYISQYNFKHKIVPCEERLLKST